MNIPQADERRKNLIGGQWVEPRTGQYEPCTNPADTRDIVGRFQASTREDAIAAVDAAARAFDGWRKTPIGKRAKILMAAADHIEANVDAFAIEHVVTNLVTNALRYGTPPITVSAQCSDRHLRIAVEDRGEGVNDEFVPFLFDRFQRSERARQSPGSTGLGLAIAQSYAHAHGGDLVYSPARPKGARFELVIPTTNG